MPAAGPVWRCPAGPAPARRWRGPGSPRRSSLSGYGSRSRRTHQTGGHLGSEGGELVDLLVTRAGLEPDLHVTHPHGLELQQGLGDALRRTRHDVGPDVPGPNAPVEELADGTQLDGGLASHPATAVEEVGDLHG